MLQVTTAPAGSLPLPRLPGFVIRPITLDDVDEVHRLAASAAIAAIGSADTSRDDIRSELQDPLLHLPSDTLLVRTDEPGAVTVGYGLAYDEGAPRAYVDVYLDPGLADETYQLVGSTLLDHALARTRQILVQSERSQVLVVAGSYATEGRQRALLEAAGFTPERDYWRMQVVLADRPQRPPPPDRVSLRRLVLADEADRRVAHRLTEDAFVEHHGYHPTSYETFWQQHRLDDPVLDASMWWVAEVDGAAAGLLIGNESRLDDDAGYVADLGVLPAYRGRGIAKHLLHEAFDQYAERGRKVVTLGVDSANATGATALYESVGMTPIATIVSYARSLSV